MEVGQENVTGTSHVVGSKEMGDDPAFKATLMKSYGQPWDWYPIRRAIYCDGGFCDAEDQAANGANGKGGKPLIKKLFSKLEASKCWTKKSQLITLTNRTHTKALATRTSGKSCFAKSHSHPVPQAGDWVSQGNMLLSCISRTSQHPWKLEAWKLGLLWRNDLPQVLYIFLMSGTV